MPCIPPGELCALRGGVFVSTVKPRQRMACGWYSSETMRPEEGASPSAIVGTVVANHEHIERRDSAFFREADFHPAVKAGRARPMNVSSSRLMRIMTGAFVFFASSAGIIIDDAAGDLAAEATAGVFADEHNFVRASIFSQRAMAGSGLRGALRAGSECRLCRSASKPSRCAFRGSDGWCSGVTNVSSRTSAAFLNPASRSPKRPFVGRLAHRQVGHALSSAKSASVHLSSVTTGGPGACALEPAAASRRCHRVRGFGPPGRSVSSGSTTKGSGSKSISNFLDRFRGREFVDRGHGENRLALINRLHW